MSGTRSEQTRAKSKAWDKANMDKRRASDRESKRRRRAKGLCKPCPPRTWEALEAKRLRDKRYSRKRRLLGLHRPSLNPPKFFSLDEPRTENGQTLADRIPSASLSPSEILMIKEDYLAGIRGNLNFKILAGLVLKAGPCRLTVND